MTDDIAEGLGVDTTGVKQGLGDHTTTGEVLTGGGGDIEEDTDGFGDTQDAH